MRHILVLSVFGWVALGCPQALKLLKTPSQGLDNSTKSTIRELGLKPFEVALFSRELGSDFSRLIRFYQDPRTLAFVADYLAKNPPKWIENPTYADLLERKQHLDRALAEGGYGDLKPDERFLIEFSVANYLPYLKNHDLTGAGTRSEIQKRLRKIFGHNLVNHFQVQTTPTSHLPPVANYEAARAQTLMREKFQIVAAGYELYQELHIPLLRNKMGNNFHGDHAADILAFNSRDTSFLIEEVKPLLPGSESTAESIEKIERAVEQLASTLRYLRQKEGENVRARLQISTLKGTPDLIQASGYEVRNSLLFKDGKPVRAEGIPVFVIADPTASR